MTVILSNTERYKKVKWLYPSFIYLFIIYSSDCRLKLKPIRQTSGCWGWWEAGGGLQRSGRVTASYSPPTGAGVVRAANRTSRNSTVPGQGLLVESTSDYNNTFKIRLWCLMLKQIFALQTNMVSSTLEPLSSGFFIISPTIEVFY